MNNNTEKGRLTQPQDDEVIVIDPEIELEKIKNMDYSKESINPLSIVDFNKEINNA